MDRFGQIAPKILFAADGYLYNGKEIDLLPRLRQIAFRIPSLEHVVVTPYRKQIPDLDGVRKGTLWSRFIATQFALAASRQTPPLGVPRKTPAEGIRRTPPEPVRNDGSVTEAQHKTLELERFPFDHPLYI